MKYQTLLLVLFGLIGCHSDTSGIRIEDSKLVIDNPRFASHFHVTHQLKRKLDNGLVHVQLAIQNEDRGDVRFQYRFEWLDADGMVLEETLPTWQVATIHGKNRKVIEAVSESKDAADFRIVVRSL